jgi:hypothetical protein
MSELPDHLTREKVKQYAREADSMFEFTQKTRVNRELARRILNQVESVDGVDTADARQIHSAPTNIPSDHGTPTHSKGRFLWECDPRTPLDELGELWQRWEGSGDRDDLGEWGESDE